MIDEGDCGVIGGMKIGRGNQSTRRYLLEFDTLSEYFIQLLEGCSGFHRFAYFAFLETEFKIFKLRTTFKNCWVDLNQQTCC
jgi:hypothetical protein